LTWVPTETVEGRAVYYHLCVSYFVVDLPPVRAYQTPIQPDSVEPWRWLSQWLIEWVKEVGKFADDPKSITEASLDSFYKAKDYHMEDYPPPPEGWKTFNQFFSRKIDMTKRPIDPNKKAIVSPADSTFGGWWHINDEAEVTIKNLPWSMSTLLKDSTYGKSFAGGKFMHAYLNTYDYHRQHAPVSGKVVEAIVVPGLCYLEVVPIPLDKNERDAGKPGFSMKRKMHPLDSDALAEDDPYMPDSAGYQFLQARGCIVIDTTGYENDIGLVAVLPIGMATVSSVVLHPKVVAHGEVMKGEEICHFEMGGSDIIVCFQKDANVTITSPMEQHNNVGVQIALAP